MVSCFPGVKYAPLYYRALENDKTDALKMNGWNLDGKMYISDTATCKEDMSWWLANIDNDPCPIMPTKYKLTLKCDSSLEGWGSVIDNPSIVANGRWTPTRQYAPHKLLGNQSSPLWSPVLVLRVGKLQHQSVV